MEYRVEKKYLVTDAELSVIHQRLKAVMQTDSHQIGSCYEIRSLYFDDFQNRCLDENDAGIDQREKFRIRIYDPEASVIHLEIKEKNQGLTKKRACDLSKEECLSIMDGSLPLIMDHRSVLKQLQIQMRCAGMQPKAVIVYERSAFVCPTGNVRITFDRNIMASKVCDTFFDERVCSLVPVLPTGMHILEVKYDELLPDFIAQQLEIHTLRQTAFLNITWEEWL